jgi:hypothetical protein
MRLYAKSCRNKAQGFGELLSEHPSRQKWAMIDCLILEVWLRTRKFHDKEIAVLLTNAAEATHQKRIFTDDQIKKHRQKYLAHRVQAYQVLHPPEASSEP